MKYSPEAAFQSKEEIKAMQEEKLQETIAYLNEHSPFYKEFFSQAKFNPRGIKTIEDLNVIPVTIKEDLQQVISRACRCRITIRKYNLVMCIPGSRNG